MTTLSLHQNLPSETPCKCSWAGCGWVTPARTLNEIQGPNTSSIQVKKSQPANAPNVLRSPTS